MSAGPASLLNIQRGELTAEGWTQVHTYQVFTTDGTDGPDVVLGAAGLPAFNSGLAYDALARAQRITPIKQTDATIHWHVEVEYGRETASDQDSQNPPTLRPVKRSSGVRWVEKALMVDKDGKAILTGAQTPFDPPITVQVPHYVAKFQRWEDSFSTSAADAYLGKVNSSAFGAYAAGRVLCTNIDASEEWEQNEDGDLQRYWLVTYEFEASQEFDPWQPLKLLNADVWHLDASGVRKLTYVDSAGDYGSKEDLEADAVRVPKPVPLSDANGTTATVGFPIAAEYLPDEANYLEFNIYDEADFNGLDLPVN